MLKPWAGNIGRSGEVLDIEILGVNHDYKRVIPDIWVKFENEGTKVLDWSWMFFQSIDRQLNKFLILSCSANVSCAEP